MDFEQVQTAIDGLDQPRLSGQQVHRPNPPGHQTPCPVRQFVMDVASRKHGLGLVGPVTLPQPILDSTFAIDQPPLAFDLLLCDTLAHSKCLLAKGNRSYLPPFITAKRRHFEYFFAFRRTKHA